MKKNILYRIIIILFFFVTFFSYFKVNAATFKYSEFDWEEFSHKNNNFWVSLCDPNDDTCEDKLLKTKKNFYVNLYKYLTKMQNKGYFIDDTYIIATVFLGLDGESFKDPEYGGTSYNLDLSEDSENTNIVDVTENAKEYFENETDTLKTLINAFVGYEGKCYGFSKDLVLNDDGTNNCDNNEYVVGDKCAVIVKDNMNGNFADIIGLNIFSNSLEDECKSLYSEKYTDGSLVLSTTKTVNVDFYWDFLENTNYFDKKSQLQDYYIGVYGNTEYSSMIEIINSSDYEKIYKEKEEEIKSVRKRLINRVKEIVKNYIGNSKKYNSVTSCSNCYLWPIGSDEVTEENGVTFALGELELSSSGTGKVASEFGRRVAPKTGASTNHKGIDINGGWSDGVVNVIASKEGVVIDVFNKCTNSSGDNCGGKRGNYIRISHSDGNYTTYEHLAANSITVSVGDSVSAGEVIGKVGTTGMSTGVHLHFEIGEGSITNVVDPLNYVSVDEPRCSLSCGTGDIIIPEEYGNSGVFTYTKINGINWSYNQKKVYDKWLSLGSETDENNIAMIDGRFLIACTTTYGNVGDKIDFYLEDGTKLETIMMDAKSQEFTSYDSNPANMWGHNDGQQVIEFEITNSKDGSGNVGSWFNLINGKRVASATNLGENILE